MVRVQWNLECEEDFPKMFEGLDFHKELQTDVDKFIGSEFKRIHPDALCDWRDLPLTTEEVGL
jgi:hypothetical protein